MLETNGLAGLGKALGAVSRAVIRHELTALHTLSVEPGDSAVQEPDRGGLRLVHQHCHIGQTRGVINGHVDPFIAGSCGAALLPVADDPMSELAETGELFDVDVEQVAGPLSLVALNRMPLLHRSVSAWAPDFAAGPGPAE